MRAIILPAILLVYLIVMVIPGWPSFQTGAISATLYFGGTVLTPACIFSLHLLLKMKKKHVCNSSKDRL